MKYLTEDAIHFHGTNLKIKSEEALSLVCKIVNAGTKPKRYCLKTVDL